MSKIKQLWMRVPIKRAFFGALLVAAVGVWLIAASGAVTYTASSEAESGARTSQVVSVDDSKASGGKAIRFTSPTPTTPPSTPPPTTPPSSATKCASLANLKFCDDFDGGANTAPDTAKWSILTYSAWGGQCFRNQRENLAHDGQGNMKMTLINKGSTQCTDGEGYPTSVTSGGMDTKGKYTFKYGKVEVRAKIACAKSVWGAIWTATGTGPAWPQSGEIDIYEQFEGKQNSLKNTIHAGNPHWQKGASITNASGRLCDDFHTYGVDWRQGSIQFMLDGKNTTKFTSADAAGRPWPFDTYDQRMLIDLQYGSPGWPSAGAYDATELPSSMLVDYIRIYN